MSSSCILIGLMTLVLAGGDAPSTSQPAPETAEPLNPEWLKLDEQRADEIRALNVPTVTVERLLSVPRLHHEDDSFPQLSSDCRDLGFGTRLCRITRHGGYASYTVSLLEVDGQIARRELRISGHAASTQWSFPVYERQVKGLKLVRHESSLAWELAERDVLDRVEKEGLDKLGAMRATAVPDDLKEAYALLTNPMNELWVGEVCGIGGTPPPGREAIGALERAGRFDLISNILRSLSPEGRVYAAEALLKRRAAGGEVSEDDLRVIKIVRKFNTPIWNCEGCIVGMEPARNLLPPIDAPATRPTDK